MFQRHHTPQPPQAALGNRHGLAGRKLLRPLGHDPQACGQWLHTCSSYSKGLHHLHQAVKIALLALEQVINVGWRLARLIIQRPEVQQTTQRAYFARRGIGAISGDPYGQRRHDRILVYRVSMDDLNRLAQRRQLGDQRRPHRPWLSIRAGQEKPVPRCRRWHGPCTGLLLPTYGVEHGRNLGCHLVQTIFCLQRRQHFGDRGAGVKIKFISFHDQIGQLLNRLGGQPGRRVRVCGLTIAGCRLSGRPVARSLERIGWQGDLPSPL